MSVKDIEALRLFVSGVDTSIHAKWVAIEAIEREAARKQQARERAEFKRRMAR